MCAINSSVIGTGSQTHKPCKLLPPYFILKKVLISPKFSQISSCMDPPLPGPNQSVKSGTYTNAAADLSVCLVVLCGWLLWGFEAQLAHASQCRGPVAFYRPRTGLMRQSHGKGSCAGFQPGASTELLVVCPEGRKFQASKNLPCDIKKVTAMWQHPSE